MTPPAFHRYVIQKEKEAVNPDNIGTKAAGLFHFVIPAGESIVVRCRLRSEKEHNYLAAFEQFDETITARIQEADEFYASVIPNNIPEPEQMICRQGYAGLLWTKQFFHYVVDD
jgi:hypothetical protein